MVRSSVSTSGLAWRAWRKASGPSAASPTTTMSGWGLMSSRSPARTIAWSSAIRTRILPMFLLPEGYIHVDCGSASGPRLERDGAVQKGGPFADVEQAQTNACARLLEQRIVVEPTSVVLHRQMYARRLAPDHAADRLGRRVLQDIRERLLGDAVQSRLHFCRQTGQGQVRGDPIDRDSVRLGVIDRVALQGCRKAQIVQNARSQAPGQTPDLIQERGGDAAEFPQPRSRFLKRRHLCGRSQPKEQRRDGLADAVVEVPRNPALLLFPCRHDLFEEPGAGLVGFRRAFLPSSFCCQDRVVARLEERLAQGRQQFGIHFQGGPLNRMFQSSHLPGPWR